MKLLYILILSMVTLSCKPKKELLPNSISSEKTLEVVCPENGKCTLSVLKSTNLNIAYISKKELYVKEEEGEKVVLKYEYRKNSNKDLADSSYREEIFIELDPNNIEVDTNTIKEEAVFFARWCYCKGQTGYYKVKVGNLVVKKVGKKQYNVHLEFKIHEVPQVIQQINTTFHL